MSEDRCAACGAETPIHLLDAKPGPGIFTPAQLSEAADRGDDFSRLECAKCYGPGYVGADQ
jgi:hypothetical protein